MAFVTLDLNPPPRTLRNFGLIGVVAFGLIAVLVYGHHKPFSRVPGAATLPVTYVAAAFAAYCGLFAVTVPQALRWLYVGLSLVGFPIGFIFSYIIVTIMFFLVVTPIALLFKVIRRDTLKLRSDLQATTYWVRRTPPDSIKRYFRQF
jgi:hypothetical protein